MITLSRLDRLSEPIILVPGHVMAQFLNQNTRVCPGVLILPVHV